MFKYKHNSKTGASMIMALVFLLFCAFVGGSVITAATANASRLSHMSDQQDFLNQRSACLLMVDELKTSTGSMPEIFVSDSSKIVQAVEIVEGGGYVNIGAPVPVRDVLFKIYPKNIETPMQRILCESAILRYAKQHGLKPADIKLEPDSVTYEGSYINSVADFWTKDEYNPDDSAKEIAGSLQVSGKITTPGAAPDEFTKFGAGFHCLGPGPKGTTLYDFDLDFGSYSEMRVEADAMLGSTHYAYKEPFKPDAPDSNTGKIVQTSKTITVISWDTPQIAKGGV